MFIHGPVYIRAITSDDLDFLAEMRNDPSTWMNLGTLNFTNRARQEEWLKKSSLDSSRSNFIVCKLSTRERIGFVRMDELDTVNGSVRVGADLAAQFRGKKFAPAIYRLLMHYCFDYLRLNRVWLLVLEGNVYGRRLYNKIGAKEEGVMREAVFRGGKYHNYIVMSMLKREFKERIGEHSEIIECQE